MSEFSLILVLQKKQENPTIDMARKRRMKSNESSMIWTMVSGRTDCPNPSWQRTQCSFFLQHLSVTFTRPLFKDLTSRSSDSMQQVAYKRLSSGLSLYQPSESGHQGGMCWISIPVIMLTQMFSRLILDNAYNLWEWYCVLTQVTLWGKGCCRQKWVFQPQFIW